MNASCTPALRRVRSREELRALGGVSRAELRELLRILVVALADSDRAHDLMIVEEILNRRRVAQLLQSPRYFAGEEARELLRDQPLINRRTVDLDALRRSRPGTLGRAFVQHLDRHDLDLDLFDEPTPRLADEPDIGWLVQRNRQTHDIMHTLLGLGVQGYEEILTHAFLLGHAGVPQSLFITLFGAIKHVLLEARWSVLAHGLRAAYRAGKRCAPFWAVYWERHWDAPVDDMRRRLGIEDLGAHL